jgi:hypothetical protein
LLLISFFLRDKRMVAIGFFFIFRREGSQRTLEMIPWYILKDKEHCDEK